MSRHVHNFIIFISKNTTKDRITTIVDLVCAFCSYSLNLRQYSYSNVDKRAK